MKKLINNIFILLVTLSIASCTLPPKSVGNEARNQAVNENLVCAKQIDIIQISINGAKPPKTSFQLAMKNLKKYTTKNIYLHKSIELTIPKNNINSFIHIFADHANGDYLTKKQRLMFRGFLRKDSTIVMIYTPTLNEESDNNSQEKRGLAFSTNTYQPINVVAYNQTKINKSPVISNIQAWKIVLTHELGHRLGVPSANTHNKAGHCTRRECVLYESPDASSILSVALNGMPYDYCRVCKAELVATKKRCSARN